MRGHGEKKAEEPTECNLPACRGSVTINQLPDIRRVRPVSFRFDEKRGFHRHEELDGGVDPNQMAFCIQHRSTTIAGAEGDVVLEA